MSEKLIELKKKGGGTPQLTFTNYGAGTPSSSITAKIVFAFAGKGSTGASVNIVRGSYSAVNGMSSVGASNWSASGVVFFDADELVLSGTNQLSVCTVDF